MEFKNELKSMVRPGIKRKILQLILGLSLTILLLVGYLSVTTIGHQGDYTRAQSEKLGEQAAADSSQALKSQADDYLSHIAEDQAILSNALLKNVAEDIRIMAALAASALEVPGSGSSGRNPIANRRSGATTFVQSILMNSIFNLIRDKNNYLDRLAMGRPSGDVIYYPPQTFSEQYDFRERPWYKNAVTSGDVVWMNPYVSASNGQKMVTCSCPFYNKAGQLLGVVKADINLYTLNHTILNIRARGFCYAFLIDHTGTIIDYIDAGETTANTGNDTDSAPLTQAQHKQKHPELFNIARKIATRDGFKKNSLPQKITGQQKENQIDAYEPIKFIPDEKNGEDKYLAYSYIPVTRWWLAIAIPMTVITGPGDEIKSRITEKTAETTTQLNYEEKKLIMWLLVMFVVLTLLVLFLGVRSAKKIINPILELNRGAIIMGSGNLDFRFHIKSDGDEIELLAETFNTMAADLKLYMTHLAQTTAEKERIESDLRVANHIQASMLPRIFPAFPTRKEFDIYALMDPAKEVGGDFYDFFFVTDNKLCFLIGDVAGKGVQAALFMVITKTLLKTEALRGIPPVEVLNNVNRILYPDNDESMFVTVFCALLDTQTGSVEYGIAGHNPPLLYRNGSGNYDYIKPEKSFVLAVMETAKFGAGSFTLAPGDALFLYSDGVTEAMNEKSELFSEARLRDSLAPLKDRSTSEISLGIKKAVSEHVQTAPQSDDITILSLRFKGDGDPGAE